MSWTCKQIIAFLRVYFYGVTSMPATLTDAPVSAPPSKRTVGDVFKNVDATAATVVEIQDELKAAEATHGDAVKAVDDVLSKHGFALIDGLVYAPDKDSLTGYSAHKPATEDTPLD